MKGLGRYLGVAVTSALLALGASQAMASLHPSVVAWPSACKRMACVNNHLNNLDPRMRSAHRQIVSLQSTVAGLQSQLQSVENQVNCYGTLDISQYPAGQGTSSGTTAPGSGGTWLDLMHPDNPANNAVYHVVRSFC